MKSLSIVIPDYNGHNYIENCVESIAKQDNGKIEVVIVNDGSTDDTALLCKSLTEKYTFVKYFEKKNGGVSSARNFALSKISGEYVWFVDADDTITNNAIEEIFKIKYDLAVYNFYTLNDKDEKLLRLTDSDYTYQISSIDEFFKEYVFKYKLNNALWNKIFKTSIIKENNLTFDEKVKIGEDYLFSLNYYKFIKEIEFFKAPIYKYYINESGAMKNKKIAVFNYQQQIAQTVKKEYKDLLSNSTLQQFLLMQLVCGINQSKERGVDKKQINKNVKNYMQEIMSGKRFSKSVINNFLDSEGASLLSKIKFKIFYAKIYR